MDDDADDRHYFLEALHEIDPTIECVTAKDGQQGMEILEDRANSLPHLIFLDLRMPRYNGKRCLQQMKADPRLQAIPVIIYTTSRELQDSEEMQNLGAVHFISKPTNPDEIFYVLSLALEGQLGNGGFRGEG